jgi:hypothetical protein
VFIIHEPTLWPRLPGPRWTLVPSSAHQISSPTNLRVRDRRPGWEL